MIKYIFKYFRSYRLILIHEIGRARNTSQLGSPFNNMVFGKGTQTNMTEISKAGAIAKHKKYPQEGKDNPNWKEGRSKDNYYYRKIQIKRFPEKEKARRLVHLAIKSGKLIKPDNCEECEGRTSRLEGHHEDYTQPLKVKWLCVGCHRSVHG